MILNLWQRKADSTVYVPFHTFDSNDPTASVTITGLAVTDIEIYRDGGTTQRASDSGYTLLDTDGTDFDGTTGLHGFSIDLSDDSDTGFYAAGSFYMVAVSAITVDAATVNFWACVFDIVTNNVDDVVTDTEAILTDTEAIIADTELILADSEAVLADTEASQTTESNILADTEAAVADTEAIVLDTNELQGDWTDGGRLDTILDAILADTEAAAPVLTDTEAILGDTETVLVDTEAILADTESLAASGLTPLASGTAQSGTASTIVLAASETFADDELNGNIVKITGGTGAGQSRMITSNTNADDTCNVSPNWATNPDATSTYEIVEGAANLVTVGLTPQTAGDIVADTEATLTDTEASQTAEASILADTEASQASESSILSDTEATLADTEAAATSLTNISADTEATVTDTEAILADSEAAVTDTEAILADTELAVDGIVQGTVDTVTNGHTPTTTVFQADDITEATADHFIGRTVVFLTGALADQATDITDYEAVGGIAQFTVTALTEAPANNDTFKIV